MINFLVVKSFFSLLQIIPSIPWYTERVITNITLGGLLVLVVLRTIQYNMTKMRVSTFKVA